VKHALLELRSVSMSASAEPKRMRSAESKRSDAACDDHMTRDSLLRYWHRWTRPSMGKMR